MNIHSHSLPSSGKLTYTLTNDYLFRAAIQKNPEASKGLAAALLDIPLESIQELIVANPTTIFHDYLPISNPVKITEKRSPVFTSKFLPIPCFRKIHNSTVKTISATKKHIMYILEISASMC